MYTYIRVQKVVYVFYGLERCVRVLGFTLFRAAVCVCVFSFFCALRVSLSSEEFSKLSPLWILRLFSSSSVVIVTESFREEKAAPSGIFIHVFEFSKRFKYCTSHDDIGGNLGRGAYARRRPRHC